MSPCTKCNAAFEKNNYIAASIVCNHFYHATTQWSGASSSKIEVGIQVEFKDFIGKLVCTANAGEHKCLVHLKDTMNEKRGEIEGTMNDVFSDLKSLQNKVLRYLQ